MAEPVGPLAEEVIDLRAYLRVIGKWRRVIIAGTVVAVLTAGILSFFVLPPVYEAKALLLVTQATDKQQMVRPAGEGVEGIIEPLTRIPVLTMNTYLGQVKSEVLLRRVIEKLKLDPLIYTPGSLAQTIKATVQKDSNLIEITVRNGDQKLAAAIANALSKEYLQFLSEKNQEQMSRSVSFLKEQQKKTSAELDKAIQALKNMQSQPRGVAVLEEEFKLKAGDLANYKSRRDTVVVEIQQLQAGVDRLAQELAATPPRVPVDRFDPETRTMVSGEESNPVYERIAEKLADKKALLSEKQAELTAIEGLTSGLSGSLDQLQAELTEKRTKQDKLQSEVDRLKETLNTLASKTTETQIARSLDLGQTSVVVISDANTPTKPVRPNKKLNVAVALVLGLMVFTSLAFVLEHLDYTVKSPEDVAQHLELPVIGIIPLATPKTSKASYGHSP